MGFNELGPGFSEELMRNKPRGGRAEGVSNAAREGRRWLGLAVELKKVR
jgi:hypothetical protein